MTTKESFAALLDGRQHHNAVTMEIAASAKASGLLIICGASDDSMQFYGAYRDETECYEGGIAHLDRAGVLHRPDDGDDNDIADFVIRKRSSRTVEALWEAEGEYSWTYRTDIPHATFDIFDDGVPPYCRGIVIDTADLPERQGLV